MSGMGKETRLVTDSLDAIGNTMKAVTKGYAIASAGLAALVLFGSYVSSEPTRVWLGATELTQRIFRLSGLKLSLGSLLEDCCRSSFVLSVWKPWVRAGAVVKEVRRQLEKKPGTLTGTDRPEYGACVDIVTKAALREMIVPALLPVILVVVAAYLGPLVLGGLLIGTIVTGRRGARPVGPPGGAVN